MSIKFLNINSKEVRVAETEPQIAALWSSSDRSPNITQGQDFGWRLAPEVVVELNRILADGSERLRLASRYAIPAEDVDEKIVLQYISEITDEKDAPVAKDGDYTKFYNAEIERIEKSKAKAEKAEKADKEA